MQDLEMHRANVRAMLRAAMMAVAFLLASGPAHATVQDAALDGTWQGAFSRGGSIQVVDITFSRDASGVLRASYSIPELTLYDEPVRDLKVSGSTLQMHFIYGIFSALIDPTAIQITGSNTAWKPPVNLDLKRMPQTTPYTTQDVVVRNGNVSLAGTLYLPKSPTPVPLVIVIPGSNDAGRKQWESYGSGAARG